jgi:hypothetical protein
MMTRRIVIHHLGSKFVFFVYKGCWVGLFRVFFVFFLCWVVSGFLFGFLCILFVYLETRLCVPWVVGLGFLCILETLCVLVLVYLEAHCAFFWYIIL